MRAFALAAVVVAAAGCGGRGQGWPDCLRILGATHVQVAAQGALAKTPDVFGAERAAAVEFSDGAQARIVVSKTPEAAAKTAIALGSVPSVVTLPGPATVPQPNVILRRGRVVLQWYGSRGAERRQTLFTCATR